MSHRNFLRKQVIEYKELNGLRKGFRVSAIVNDQPEQGTVKWIGTIKGTMYIGIQFENRVGNQFPEMNGAPPFPCSIAHSRLVFPVDVKISAAAEVAIMEQTQRQLQQQDDAHYLLQPMLYLRLDENNAAGKAHVTHRQLNHSHNSDFSEDDSQFVSTSTPINGNSDSVELKELGDALSSFYKCCAHAKRMIKDCHANYEEHPIHCRFEDCASLNLNLEKLKHFRSEVEDVFVNHIEQCKLEMETVLRYSDELLPSEEREMSHEIQEIEQIFNSLDSEVCSEAESVENFCTAYQKLQDILQERFSRFSVIKTRLLQVQRNLVKDESALSLRIKGIQSILSVLERDHDSSENSEFSRLLSEIQLYNYFDISRTLSQIQDLILSERQLLDEVRIKRALLKEAKESFQRFMDIYTKFQDWYADYMKRLNETKVTGPDFDLQYPSLVTEREERRKEFIEILSSARNLRASIFDSSAVDQKIDALQDQWKVLVEKVYRARSRKTV